MLAYIKRHKETLLVTLSGLVIFGLLNLMMVNVDPKRLTNPYSGSYAAFEKLVVSGFDFFAYCIVSLWKPRYELYRHPLLSVLLWPLSEVNKGLKDASGINCAIYIIGTIWTILSTVAWLCLYRIIRKVIGLPWIHSLLYCLLFFSFSHVMIVTFFPDHMLLSMCILLCSVYVISAAKGQMPLWKSLLIYFVGTGVTTTNSVKLWMIDMCGKYSAALSFRENLRRMIKRSLFFFIPTMLLLGCYYWQMNTTQASYQKWHNYVVAKMMKGKTASPKNIKSSAEKKATSNQTRKNTQIGSSELFKCTDTSIDRLTLVYENLFGEGLLLHDTHILEDISSNTKTRPVFVKYTHWWYYMVNGLIVLLCMLGMWAGRHKSIMWMVLLPFLFDMILHVGLLFAARDVYIMTAHWAFVLPIGIALLAKSLEKRKMCSKVLFGVVLLTTIFLWWHNLSLTATHLMQCH